MKKVISKMKKGHPCGSRIVLKNVKRENLSRKNKPSERYHCVLYHSQVEAMKKWIADALGEAV